MDSRDLAAQRVIDYIEEHACENPTLAEISREAGYSPFYCSEQFHRIAGTTIRDYILKRRLAMAAKDLRETGIPIVEIALKYGFSDQSVFTKSFKRTFGRTPYQYRKHPTPLPVVCKKMILKPFKNENGGSFMSITKPYVRMEFIPEHKYLGVYKRSETKNGPVWPGHDCELTCGILSSLKDSDLDRIVTRFTSGWTWENGERSYIFGAGVPVDYRKEVPDGFELRGEFPGSYYLAFCHPPFDYLSENEGVIKAVGDMAWSFDPGTLGLEWNEEKCQDYERHYPEVVGYQILRPVRGIGE